MNSPEKMSVLIRAFRKQTGLTQEKLAAKLGVTFPTVNRWEHGRSKPSPLAIQRIKELISTTGKDIPKPITNSDSSYWPLRDNLEPPEFNKEVVYIDTWPVLEQGTD